MIMSAPNGARRTASDHPALPITSSELADCATALVDAGAAVLHLHVRDEKGSHTLDVARYRDAIDTIRDAIDDRLILQITTEAVGRYRADEQMNVVRELRPEAVSLALRELCPDEQSETASSLFFNWLVSERIWPQYILYDVTDLQRFDSMRKRGIFGDERPHCLFVLGRYADDEHGSPQHLDALLSAADCAQFPWSVCCFGPAELEAARYACSQRGHVRLGFENNVVLADGRPARDNAELVEQFVDATRSGGRVPASAADVRELLLVR